MKLIDALTFALDMFHEAIGQLSEQELAPEETVALYQLQAARLRLTEFVNEMQPESKKYGVSGCAEGG